MELFSHVSQSCFDDRGSDIRMYYGMILSVFMCMHDMSLPQFFVEGKIFGLLWIMHLRVPGVFIIVNLSGYMNLFGCNNVLLCMYFWKRWLFVNVICPWRYRIFICIYKPDMQNA